MSINQGKPKSNQLNTELLSDIVVFNKYAKYIPKLKRRESFNEIVDRYEGMMIKRYPKLEDQIINNIQFVRDKKVLPSMRAMQFAGKAIEKNEARIYNCCFLPIDDYRSFSEIMFLLLGGTGVGYSVQSSHVEKLPSVIKPLKDQKYLIGDSIEGWSDSVRHLMASYFGKRSTKPKFDFSDIREKGARLITAGGKAPGPEPLKRCLFELELILDSKKNGEKLSTLEVHSICCHIADAVLAGGIRRAALICLFSADDESMLKCKSGNWWELNPHFGRANNSAVLVRHRITKDYFLSLWKKIELSGSGEPGIYLTNNKDWGTNPCCEISLRPYSFCNLTEVNVSNVKDDEDLQQRAKVASFLGTLQAGFTNFHYLRPIWRHTTEKDALIGVGQTGIASGAVLSLDLEAATNIVISTNKEIAHIIGINQAARTTTIKPSGTTSLVLGTSSGIHAWHNNYYIRRMQLTKSDDLYKFLVKVCPQLLKDYEAIPNTAVLEIPIEAPDGSIIRKDETALGLLERVKLFSQNWVRNGHRSGDNTHNVSATISIKPNEWKEVGEWMWENKEFYNGLSVLPFDGGTYHQAPFEDITLKEYNLLSSKLVDIDLTKLVEEDDITDLANELACSGGSCEIF